MPIIEVEITDSIVTEVRMPKYGLLEFSVWTGGDHIHSSPVSNPKADDIWENCNVSGHETNTIESIKWSPQCETEIVAIDELGEIRVVKPMANSQTPIIMQR